MKKILTIIGARPQIIKASAISREINQYFSEQIEEIIVHTGQHYDENMSKVFFEELSIPEPKYNLNVGSSTHGDQTSKMIKGIEELIELEHPSFLLIYGDTNSTLAGAIAASKVHVPIIHVEAGLRSFNKRMPEEINRILSDHCSTYLFTPTLTGFNNLIKEGFKITSKHPFTVDNPLISNIGDVMFDNALYFSEIAEKRSLIMDRLKLVDNNFILCTIHRNDNTDNIANLNEIFRALIEVVSVYKTKLVLPIHPRTKSKLQYLNSELYSNLKSDSNFIFIDPVSFFDMILLEKKSKFIVTDSGGVQKEAYFFNKPCVILRKETEWIELVDEGVAFITGSNQKQILSVIEKIFTQDFNFNKKLFGDGKAAHKILRTILLE